MLIAAPALTLLRRSFPASEISLVCAPWNVGLARRLGIADVIHGSTIFAQISAHDMDAAARIKRRRAAVAALQELDLGRFDLAIDLRRDEDTRELLKLFDADAYAGMGDLATYSFLDVACAVTHLGINKGASELRLGPADFASSADHRIGADGFHLTASTSEVDLSIRTDAIWSPSEHGQDDSRLLGVGLWDILLRRRIGAGGDGDILSPPVELPPDSLDFGPGWHGAESWGRWTSRDAAHATLRFSTSAPDVELLVRVQGHTSPAHDVVNVTVAAGDAEVSHVFRAGDEAATLRLACRAKMYSPAATSEPVLLRAGRYQGTLQVYLPAKEDWEPLTLSVTGARLGHVVGRLTTPDSVAHAGLVEFPFELELRDAAEPIRVEIRMEGRRPERRLAIVGVDLRCMQARSPILPVTHMERQLLDLAAMVALRYAPTLVKPDAAAIADRLSAAADASTGSGPARRLRAARLGKRLFGPPRPRRLIGVGIGANKETKRWAPGYFAELCRRLLAVEDIALVFVGGPAEAGEVAALRSELDAKGRALDLCGCCRIEDLGELLAELDGYIGLDTGTTHFAGRVGIRTLAIFGAAHDPREWGPVGARSGWAAEEIACQSCFLSLASECAIGVACMSDLTPDRVWPLVERHILA